MLPDGETDAYIELRQRLHQQLAPESTLEASILYRIAALFWRLRRLGRVELEMFK